jgi:dTDP-4-dehydrorhamnose reductase
LNIIITGANGMLGSSICQLYHNKHKVYALHRDKKCFTSCSADYSLDLTDTNKVGEVFNQINPDLVIHCAGLTNVDECEKEPALAHKVNVTVTENIASLCSAETKLIYISTDQVYGKTADHSEENTNLRPVNQYGKTKLLGEQKVQELCSNFIIVRTNIFGWNMKPNRISSAEWIYNSLKNGEDITLFTDYTFSPIYTECLGEIILHLVEIDYAGIFNVGSLEPCSKYEFGISLAKCFGLNTSTIRISSIADHNFGAPRCNNLALDVSKLSHTGLTVPDYKESLKRFSQNKPY